MRRSPFLAVLLVLGAAGCAEPPPVKEPRLPQFRPETLASRLQAAEWMREIAEVVAEADSTLQVSPLEPGETVQGSLAGDDPVRAHAWVFQLADSAAVSVWASWEGPGPELSLVEEEPGALGGVIALDDSGGLASPPPLYAELGPGAYTVLVRAKTGLDPMRYELVVTLAGEGSELGAGRSLRPPRTHSALLTPSDPVLPDGTAYHVWSYQAAGGERLSVTMASDTFDARLVLLRGGPVTGTLVAMDDDGGGGRNARLSAVLPEPGLYSVVATTYAPGEEGAYELQVESDPDPRAYAFDNAGASTGRYALLVGVGDYPGATHDLSGPIQDVLAVRELLVSHFGFAESDVVVLAGADASRRNVANGVLQHLGQAGPGGMAVFYFSGLGIRTGVDLGVAERGGASDDAALVLPEAGGTASLLLDDELGYLLESLRAGRSMAILDTSHWGALSGGRGSERAPKGAGMADPGVETWLRPSTRFISAEPYVLSSLSPVARTRATLQASARVLDEPGRHLVWIAAAPDGSAWTPGSGDLGIFTQHLVAALQAAPPERTLGEIQLRVTEDVQAEATALGLSPVQRPWLSGGGDTLTVGALFRRR
jgi:hypothetical protein